MFIIDPESKSIILPKGDTLLLRMRLIGGTLPDGTVGVFVVCTDKSKPSTLLKKPFPLKGDKLTVRLTNADTRSLPVGDHLWDVRFVTDPDYDAAGDVRANDASDEVLSIFSGSGELPMFSVTSVGGEI